MAGGVGSQSGREMTGMFVWRRVYFSTRWEKTREKRKFEPVERLEWAIASGQLCDLSVAQRVWRRKEATEVLRCVAFG